MTRVPPTLLFLCLISMAQGQEINKSSAPVQEINQESNPSPLIQEVNQSAAPDQGISESLLALPLIEIGPGGAAVATTQAMRLFA